MRLGYSLLLQELVAATEVDYGDCATFQITCPACREAIFKAGKYDGDRQYFSHYAASKSDVRECELRVAAMSEEAIRMANAMGHSQTLEAFFGSFQTSVLAWMYPVKPESLATVRKQVAWMVSRPSFLIVSNWLRTTIKLNDLDKLWSQTMEGLKASEYWLLQQRRFASDFLDHLLAPNSERGWSFVLALAFYASQKMTDESQTLLVFANDSKLKKFFVKLRNAPPAPHSIPYLERYVQLHGHKDYSEMHMLAISAIQSICCVLLSIPYIDIIGETQTDFDRNRDFLYSVI